MELDVYIADCDDLGVIAELETLGLPIRKHDKYLYPTGADDPGVWVVLSFVGMSILSGVVHDAFKALFQKVSKFASKRYYEILGDENEAGPMHTCIVLKSDNMEIEIALGQEELELDFLSEVIRKCYAISTLFERENEKCAVTMPMEMYSNHWDYSRRVPDYAYRFWRLSWDQSSWIVYDDYNKTFDLEPS